MHMPFDGADITSRALRPSHAPLIRGHRSEHIDSELGEVLLTFE